ncbi:T9SS type A sorting domain-containing protein [Chitinophaga rhizophila]|uniref:T9SS type A sorting domain-containing protein n=1 Tax=Chitinophaga rhizophila TaxID=2866212 RepID=A0ABS7GCK5_9BACT|nr:T9SS type A sorting domain-containing protein [Chitinophaga rhizophila]MBW8685404.1 T9SS type A sorting domain-containing protein [Chitinophaga rhizophila]
MWKTSTLLFTCLICLFSLVGKAQNTKTSPFSDGGSKIVKLYPNPATSRINFELQNNNDQGYDLIVFNFLGKRIDQIKNLNARTTVELDKYYSGVYIFQLRDRQGNLVESGKFNVVK